MNQRLTLLVCIFSFHFSGFAQCEFLSILEQDSIWVQSASMSTTLDSTSFWSLLGESDTAFWSWQGDGVDIPTDLSTLELSDSSLVNFDFFISDSVASESGRDTFLLGMLGGISSEGGVFVQDSLRDIWVSFSSNLEVWANFGEDSTIRVDQIGGEPEWIGLRSFSSASTSSSDGPQWFLKYEGDTGVLADIWVVPIGAGKASLRIHGDKPDFRIYQVLLGPKDSLAQTEEYLSGEILPVSEQFLINEDSLQILVNGQVPDSNSTAIFVCIPDSESISLDISGFPEVPRKWTFGDSIVTTLEALLIGVGDQQDSLWYRVELDTLGFCATDSILIIFQVLDSMDLAEILVPDTTDFTSCNARISVAAMPFGMGIQGRWYEANGDTTLFISNTLDVSTEVSSDSVGREFQLVWETRNESCISTDSISITFRDSLNLDLGEDLTICPGDTLEIGVDLMENFLYSWLPNNEEIIESPDSNKTRVFPSSSTVFILNAENSEEECIVSDSVEVTIRTTAEIESVQVTLEEQNFSRNCNTNFPQEIVSGSQVEVAFIPSDPELSVSWEILDVDSNGVETTPPTNAGTGLIDQVLSLAEGTDAKVITYQGSVVDADCETSFTCTISFRVVADTLPLLIPKIITPNGDGDNDVWSLLNAKSSATYHVWVFNRGGGLVFESDNYTSTNNWNGGRVPDGSYWYRVQETLNELTQTYTGGLYINRNLP